MAAVRVIARLDIKGPNLVKGIHLEGLRILGQPETFAGRYAIEGADELVYVDIVASLYQRNSLTAIVEQTAKSIFIPMTVGGGIRSLQDIYTLLRAGADKVAINTAAVHRPSFIDEAARAYGAQCIVLSIEAKRQPAGSWEAYTDNGRERSGLDAVEWAREAAQRGAGEILLTSVDREGTGRGFDLELIEKVATSVPIPVIASGGAGTPTHAVEAVLRGRADAIALAFLLHYGRSTVKAVKQEMLSAGISVRM